MADDDDCKRPDNRRKARLHCRYEDNYDPLFGKSFDFITYCTDSEKVQCSREIKAPCAACCVPVAFGEKK